VTFIARRSATRDDGGRERDDDATYDNLDRLKTSHAAGAVTRHVRRGGGTGVNDVVEYERRR
jgi:hypothetical protein